MKMLSVNRKSHVICHMLTLRIFGGLKKLHFWQNCEKVLNWLNFTNWADPLKKHVQGSHGEVMCKSEVICRRHASCPEWFAFINKRSLTVRTLWKSKRRCELVITLKANKYYLELLSSLTSYINLLNFLNLKASAVGFWPLAGSIPLAPDPNLRLLAVLVLVFAFG